MKLKKITLKNIRSYKNQEIEFPEGSVLLAGDVGSGKTSILLAIEYALFGVQPGQKGTSLLRNNSKNGEVTLEFEVSGKNILIERKLKRSSKGVSNEYAAIIVDGEKVESSVTEIKSKIVSLLGYPPEFIKKNNMLYRYTVYTPQEEMKQIILEDSETRMNILRHVFGIDKYKRISENLSILLNHLRSDIKFLQGEIKSLEESSIKTDSKKTQWGALMEQVQSKQEELKKKCALRESHETELQVLENKIDEKHTFERELDKTKILLGTKQDRVSLIVREYLDVQKTIAEAGKLFDEKEYASINACIADKKKLIEQLTSQSIEIASKINTLEKEKITISDKKEKVFGFSICPTCLQDVTEVHKHNILNETETKLAEIRRQLLSLNSESSDIREQLVKPKEELAQCEIKKEELERIRAKNEYLERARLRLSELERQKQDIESDIALLSKHSESLKENLLKYGVFENQYRKKQNEVKQALFEEKQAEIEFAELRKELQILEKEIFLLEEEARKMEKRKEKLRDLTELINWLEMQFTAMIEFTERNVLLRLRNEFSRVFRNWFLTLVPENGLDCHLDENFTPILTQGETEMDYEFLSGGERTSVALAYRLALNQTVNSVLSKIRTRGIVILDEPTDGFSEAQIMKVRDILEELNATQLIIVSHEQKIESFVDAVLRVTKENDSSVVEYDSSTPP